MPTSTFASRYTPLVIEDANRLRGSIDAAIITVRQDEREAVVHRLGGTRTAKGRRYYTVGSVPMANGRNATVSVLRLPEQGNGPAQDAARDLIEDLDPHLIVLVGIGGGVPSLEVTLGDVVVAVRLADLRVQALRADQPPQLELRGERVHKGLADLLANLPQQAMRGWSERDAVGIPRPPVPLDEKRFEGPDSWKRKTREIFERHFGETNPRTRPIFYTGTIASSDSLVRDPSALRHWQEASRKIQTIEMEAAGVFEAAARVDATYPVLVARGTSDVIGYRRDAEWTAYACHTAASFIIALLRSGLLDSIRPLVSRTAATIATAKQVAPTPCAETVTPTLGALRLTKRLEPVGGPQELKIWVSEVTDNLARNVTPLFRIEFEDEPAIRAAVADLDARKDLTLDERDVRLELLKMAKQFTLARMIVGRLFSLLFKGCFERWGPDHPSHYPRFISHVLPLLAGTGREYDPERHRLCRVESERALFLHALVPLTPADVETLWRDAGLPAPLFLKTQKHPASDLPYDLRIEKFLPEILRTWLLNTFSNKDEELEDEARRTFQLEGSWFKLER